MRTFGGSLCILVLVGIFIAEAVRESRTEEWKKFIFDEFLRVHLMPLMRVHVRRLEEAMIALGRAVRPTIAAMAKLAGEIAKQFPDGVPQPEIMNEPNITTFNG